MELNTHYLKTLSFAEVK